MESLLHLLTFLAALGAALVAGIFFAFSVFIMTALGRLPAEGGISAMQSINVVVLNPVFFAVFFGTAAIALVVAITALIAWSEPGAPYLLAGSLLYLVGTILVTMVFNVPLNNRLASVAPGSAEGAAVWTRYLSAWTAWNHIRTAASLAAAAAFIIALT
ncbi:MAG: DUF1772 domain-containing protein [Methyloceanibacter sp.]